MPSLKLSALIDINLPLPILFAFNWTIPFSGDVALLSKLNNDPVVKSPPSLLIDKACPSDKEFACTPTIVPLR